MLGRYGFCVVRSILQRFVRIWADISFDSGNTAHEVLDLKFVARTTTEHG